MKLISRLFIASSIAIMIVLGVTQLAFANPGSPAWEPLRDETGNPLFCIHPSDPDDPHSGVVFRNLKTGNELCMKA
ncbi:MAG: hypothetical protein HY445_03255 [Candidatus Niyogibacteria bacterium]|nr:hypothetical protein [Candidatus Niyogibacteria bacterium]